MTQAVRSRRQPAAEPRHGPCDSDGNGREHEEEAIRLGVPRVIRLARRAQQPCRTDHGGDDGGSCENGPEIAEYPAADPFVADDELSDALPGDQPEEDRNDADDPVVL